MQIDSNTLRLALLKIFMDSGIGGWRTYNELASAWQLTGLRGADLRDAVHVMLEGGELQSAERDGALSLAVSPELLRSLMQPNAYLRLGTLEQEVSLLNAMVRDTAGDLGQRRRVSDTAEQFDD